MTSVATRRSVLRGIPAGAAAVIGAGTGSAQQVPGPPGTVRVRRGIAALVAENSPLIESYRRGVAAMMAREPSNPTSWWFQANIHGIAETDPGFDPKFARWWNQCPHQNYFFLSWHRAYLYYFERIVRDASGDPNFTLPYWDYAAPPGGTLPAPFRPLAAEMQSPPVPHTERANALARALRHPLIDSGIVAVGDAATDPRAALEQRRFVALGEEPSFGGPRAQNLRDEIGNGELENMPHNVVHDIIGIDGGWMGSPQTSTRDPIFWLHHCNLDRLWVEWIRRGDGRGNPIDDANWMKKPLVFFDERGIEQPKTAAEILDTQFDLLYRYDDDPARQDRLPNTGQQALGVVAVAAARPRPDVVVLAAAKVTPLQLEGSEIKASIPLPSTPRQAVPAAAAPKQVLLVLEDVRVSGRMWSYFEVYLNKPAEAQPDPKGPYYVGAITFFGLHDPHHGQAHAQRATRFSFDITNRLASLALQGGLRSERLDVTFIRRGGVVQGRQADLPKEAGVASVGKISIKGQMP